MPVAAAPTLSDAALPLAASDSVVADAIGVMLRGFDRLSVPFLRATHERELGIADLRQIELVGDDEWRGLGSVLESIETHGSESRQATRSLPPPPPGA